MEDSIIHWKNHPWSETKQNETGMTLMTMDTDIRSTDKFNLAILIVMMTDDDGSMDRWGSLEANILRCIF
jgi:hypothetical protein